MSTVVVLLSDKRSGSTMLQEELCRHPDIRHVASSPHRYFETHYWLMAAVVLRRPEPLFVGGKTYEGYGSRANARAYLVKLLDDNVPDFDIPDDDEALVNEGWEALCLKFGTPVFFEKSPQFLAQWCALDLLLDWMSRTEQQVRIIGLVRNPIAVQYSAQMLFATDPGARQFAWLNSNRNLLAFERMVPEASYRRIRYEDLIAHPAETFRELQKFIGVDPDPSVGGKVHGNSTEKWRQDPQFNMDLDPAVARLASTLGYDNDDLDMTVGTTAEGGVHENRQTQHRLSMNRGRDRFFRPTLLRLRAAFRRSP